MLARPGPHSSRDGPGGIRKGNGGSAMAHQPKAAPLPPNRAWWVKAMPPHRRLTWMLTEELAFLQATRERREAGEIRGFLERFRAVTRDGNVIGAELGVRKAK